MLFHGLTPLRTEPLPSRFLSHQQLRSFIWIKAARNFGTRLARGATAPQGSKAQVKAVKALQSGQSVQMWLAWKIHS
jgi:hypothetical protein